MDRADHRMMQLRDLLHNAGAPIITEEGEHGSVMLHRTPPCRPHLEQKAKLFDARGKISQLPKWLSKREKIVVMAKLRASPYMSEATMHFIGAQLSLTLKNRQLTPSHKKYLVKVTFRAVALMYGQPRFDNVKVALKTDGTEQERLYFGKCVAFFRETDSDKHYVVLRWYKEIGRDPIHSNILLARLRLEPPDQTKSYDVVPVDSIINGALLVPTGTTDHWALMSPREQAAYAAMNSRVPP